MSAREMLGRIILESIPVSQGVAVADSQIGGSRRGRRKRREAGFWGTQLIAIGGAMVFGFNVAPTMEPVMIGLRMQWWHAPALMALTLLIVHGAVYVLDIRPGREVGEEASTWRQLLGYSAVSYAMALLVAVYRLWTFGRFGPAPGTAEVLHTTVALGFVTGMGAAAAKIVL